MAPFGTELLDEKLKELRKACENYYGSINEVKYGLRTAVPDKPDALILTEQILDFKMPLAEGGILDQPHIFMLEYKICVDTKAIFEALDRANQAAQEENR